MLMQMKALSRRGRRLAHAALVPVLLLCLVCGACVSSPAQNVLTYRLRARMGTLPASSTHAGTGALSGHVLVKRAAGNGDVTILDDLSGVTIVLAEADGTPHSTQSRADGSFVLRGLPPGRYVPVALGPGFDEAIALDAFGVPRLAYVQAGITTDVGEIHLSRHIPAALPAAEPAALAAAVALTRSVEARLEAGFPPAASARKVAYSFVRDTVQVDSLRVFLPVTSTSESGPLPLIFMVYPSPVDGWESVSVAFASQGVAVVAISPMAARALDIDGHAQDARVALHLALGGALDVLPQESVDPARVVVLGGSFSSAIVHRLLRDERAVVAGWVTVGGIANALRGTADFYAGRLEIPPNYADAIPALGLPHLRPLPFVRYSPVYTAAELPPTLIIHTAADRVIPLAQALQLEQALKLANLPVDAYYYADTSHYLQIGDDLTDAGAQMFYRILDFVRAPPAPLK